MCTSNAGTNLLPYGMKISGHQSYVPFGSNMAQLTLDIQRAQLQDYTSRLQLGIRGYHGPMGLNALSYHSHLADPYLHPYFYKDPRARFIHEEPKPNHSYIGLIAMAILSHRDKKLVLSDIYQWILDNYSYFRSRGPGWRNSIRHNLSLNDCFIKSGRSANGKGHYWAIHPANIEDFQKGDFRRRRAQRRVRKHMGLAVPDDDDSPSPSPSTGVMPWADKSDEQGEDVNGANSNPNSPMGFEHPEAVEMRNKMEGPQSSPVPVKASRKRRFDMDSLLAPDIGPRAERLMRDSVNSDTESDVKEKMKTGDEGLEFEEKDKSECGTMKRTEIHTDTDSDQDSYCDPVSVKQVILSSNMLDSSMSRRNSANDGHQGSSLDGVESEVSNSLALPVPAGLKSGEVPHRPSAFHSLGQYGWTSLPGYLSNYQLMALSAATGHRAMLSQGSGAQKEAAQRWQLSMAHYLTQSKVREQTKDEASSQ